MSMGLLILAGDRAVYCMCYSASDLQFAYGKGSSSSISAHAHVRGSHALDLPHHNMRKISRNNVSNSVSIHQIYNRECQHSVGTYARGTPICSHITCYTGLRGVCVMTMSTHAIKRIPPISPAMSRFEQHYCIARPCKGVPYKCTALALSSANPGRANKCMRSMTTVVIINPRLYFHIK